MTIREHDLDELMMEHTSIVELNWDGQEQPAQIKEIQFDELNDRIIHADFARISLTERIEVTVPIETHGEAEGVREGGVLEMQTHTVEVECLPEDIPDSLEVEVSHLEIGDAVRVKDVPFPEKLTPLSNPEAVLVAVVPPTEEPEEEEELLEEVVTEPELISREEEEEEMLPEEEEEAEPEEEEE
jgi:large subunit ribosomal protein L25